MIFTDGDRRYRISFGHEVFQGKGEELVTPRGKCLVRAESRCFLVELFPENKQRLLATGFAHCYVPDNFNKNEGCVRAIRNALRQTWPDNRRLWALAHYGGVYTSRE